MESLSDRPAGVMAEFAFSDQDFRLISELANERYGLFLQPSKKALVHSRLAKRLRALGLASFQDYCHLLKQTEDESEQTHLLTALTTNVTHFFREVHHFTYLKDVIASEIAAKAKAGSSVRIWSAACSTGQEAYSIAATLLAAEPEICRMDIKILATDIDPHVIQTAREGRYPSEQVSAIPETWRSALTQGSTEANGQIQFNDALKSIITFGELNLIADWPMKRKFDVIFCRNAAIYFDKKTQARLWERFAEVLSEDGYLLIGHSERLSSPAEAAFKSVGITNYKKKRHQSQQS